MTPGSFSGGVILPYDTGSVRGRDLLPDGKWSHKVLVQELKPASLGRIVQAKNAFRGKK